MNITYLLLVKNEYSFHDLFNFVRKHKDPEDNIVVLADGHAMDEFLGQFEGDDFSVVYHDLGHSYSEHRNAALSHCKGDYTVAFDADEMPTPFFMNRIKKMLAAANYPDCLLLPRLNKVGDKVIGWPDFQTRLFRNGKGIKWVGNVHERLDIGKEHKAIFATPDEKIAIFHSKTKEQQEESTKRYLSKYTAEENAGTYQGPLE